MLLFHLFLPFILRYVKKCTQFSECYLLLYSIYIFIFLFLNVAIYWFSSLNHQAYWKKKKIWSKCYLTYQISSRIYSDYCHFGLSMAIIINYSFFQNVRLMYICNLRRHHNRFQTLRRCHGGIFNFPTLNIWEIDLLGTSYIHVDFLTCRICRTAELEVLIPTFCNTVTNYILNWLNLKIRELWNSFVTTTSQFSLNVLKLRLPVNVTILCRISDCVLMVHLCKMMISLGGFSYFSKFWFFGLLVG